MVKNTPACWAARILFQATMGQHSQKSSSSSPQFPEVFFFIVNKICLWDLQTLITAWSNNSDSFLHPGGIENLAFMPDLDPTGTLHIPPWLSGSELDSSMVAPSPRAQVSLPRTPTNLRRLDPLRFSTGSRDSFMLESISDTQQTDSDDPTHPPHPPRDDGHV